MTTDTVLGGSVNPRCCLQLASPTSSIKDTLRLGILRFFFFPSVTRNVRCPVGDPGIAEKEDADSVFMEMICPSGTNPDDSPLYVLCCNDTCSFTWTGAEHINQVSGHGGGKNV